LADALSRLPRHERQNPVGDQCPSSVPTVALQYNHQSFDTSQEDTERRHSFTTNNYNHSSVDINNEAEDSTAFTIAMDDESMLECFLNLPDLDIGNTHPLDYLALSAAQQQDEVLQQNLVDKPNQFARLQMDPNVHLICYMVRPNEPWKICIPDASLHAMVTWYHQVLNHTGITRLNDTISLHFYHKDLRTRIETMIGSCEACQKYKLPGKGYGELPPRQTNIAPWYEIAIDLIGPWKIVVQGQELIFKALTCIDTVTNYVEIIRIHSKRAEHVGLQFENAWLSRYPRPVRVIYDQGAEFLGNGFQRVLHRHGIHGSPTTVKNPQANSICERLHQTITNVLRPLLHLHPPQDQEAANLIIDSALQTAAYSARVAVHSTLKISPGALVFHRDMLLNIPLIADLHVLQQNRQALIDKRLHEANRKRISHDYQPNEEVLILTYQPDKLEPRANGPYTIERIHTNGTVTIRRNEYVTERINIRRLKPFHR
jgi:Integrase zinc binding domain